MNSLKDQVSLSRESHVEVSYTDPLTFKVIAINNFKDLKKISKLSRPNMFQNQNKDKLTVNLEVMAYKIKIEKNHIFTLIINFLIIKKHNLVNSLFHFCVMKVQIHYI